jgi:hypothetical protein
MHTGAAVILEMNFADLTDEELRAEARRRGFELHRAFHTYLHVT